MRALRLVLLLLGAYTVAHTQPRFPAGADVVSIDVSVVDSAGRPIRDLSALDFDVEVDGRPRRVRFADFIDFEGGATPAVSTSSSAATEAGTPPATATRAAGTDESQSGRLVLIAVDRGELSLGGIRIAVDALGSLVERLRPADRVAVIALPNGPRLDFTADRAAVKDALDRISPDREDALASALPPRERIDLAMRSARDRLDVLEAILGNLARIPGPKSLIFVSGGITAGASGSSSIGMVSRLRRIVTNAAASRTTFYTLFISERGRENLAEKSYYAYLDPLGDPAFRQATVETLTSMSGGILIEVVAGADRAVARVASEMSGQYVLGLEPADGDRDGKPHAVSVKVTRPGVTVRSRRQFMVPPAPRSPQSTSGADPAVPDGVNPPPPVVATPPPPGAMTRNAHIRRIELSRAKGLEGDRHLAAERYEDAALAYAEAIADDPMFVMAHYGLGKARMAQKDYAAAVAAFEDARRTFDARAARLRRRYPEEPPGLTLALGSAYFRSGRIADAEREYRAALAAEPKLAEARINLAVVLLMTGKPKEAREQVEQVKKSGANVPPGLEADIERALTASH